MELCFRQYRDVIDIDREYELTKVSPRIDFIVIKKDQEVILDNDIGRSFKRFNIIEYKKRLSSKSQKITLPLVRYGQS